MPFQKNNQINQIQKYLTYLQTYVNISNSLGQTDVNSAAEDFYCGLLNIILDGYHLKNLNQLHMNFPAIDLGDEEKQLCVQVTSTNDSKKIASTLRKFFANGLHRRYDRLIVLIIGETKKYQKEFNIEDGFDFDPERDIWDTSRLMQRISAAEPWQLDAIIQYLQTSMNVPVPSTPLHLPLHTSLGVDGFVGRRDELRALEKAIAEHAKPIILSGLGGMGKTELATHFGRNYTCGNVYLASFQKSFRETVTQSIAKGIPGLMEKKLPEEEVYHTVMNRLRQCVKDDILILDNVDKDTGSFADLMDDAYDALCGLDIGLIFTTRFDVARSIEIRQLSNSELYQIFQKHNVAISNQEMDALIQAVDGHTLTIDLMARTMKGGWRKVTAEMLLKALQEKNLAEQNYRAVSTDYNRSAKQERIYEHLRTVFNVAGVPNAAKSVLCYATLLPHDGMDSETFGMALQEEEQQALDDLIDHGWLAVKDDILTIHPVVRLVCREELKPNDEKCALFLNSVWNQCNKSDYNHIKFQQLAELYAMASTKLEDNYGEWAVRSGWYYYEVGEFSTALTYELRVVNIREENCAVKPTDLAAAYSNLGNAYGRLGSAKEAIEYQLKALAIFKVELSDNHPDIAVIYNNVGLAYGDLGENQKSLEYLLKAVTIQENNLSISRLGLAQTYSNVGLCYAELELYNTAIAFLEKAKVILEKNEDADSRFLFTLYNNLGGIHAYLSHWNEALAFQIKCVELQKRLFLDNHPDTAAIYHNMAMTYARLGNYSVALVYERKSLRIAEQFYPHDHHSIAVPKANIAYMEQKLKEIFGDDCIRRS